MSENKITDKEFLIIEAIRTLKPYDQMKIKLSDKSDMLIVDVIRHHREEIAIDRTIE